MGYVGNFEGIQFKVTFCEMWYKMPHTRIKIEFKMKIIDRESDSYDFLSTMYGVDDRLVYVREKKIEIPSHPLKMDERIIDKLNRLTMYSRWYLGEDRYNKNENVPDNANSISFYWLVICDQMIPIMTTRPKNRFCGTDYFNGKSPNSTCVMPNNNQWVIGNRLWWRNNVESFNDENMTLAKTIGEPVFAFKTDVVEQQLYRMDTIHIPKVRYISGLNSYITNEQIYQKIEMFIGEKRDKMVEPETPNDVKIRQAGFDTIYSFRKRK